MQKFKMFKKFQDGCHWSGKQTTIILTTWVCCDWRTDYMLDVTTRTGRVIPGHAYC